MQSMDNKFTDVTLPEDLEHFLDMYRGRGLAKILEQQFIELYTQDEQGAVSALGNFLELFIQHHKNAVLQQEIKDDYIYQNIKNMLSSMSKKPEYIEYSSFLEDKIATMQKADLPKNQDVE